MSVFLQWSETHVEQYSCYKYVTTQALQFQILMDTIYVHFPSISFFFGHSIISFIIPTMYYQIFVIYLLYNLGKCLCICISVNTGLFFNLLFHYKCLCLMITKFSSWIVTSQKKRKKKDKNNLLFAFQLLF